MADQPASDVELRVALAGATTICQSAHQFDRFRQDEWWRDRTRPQRARAGISGVDQRLFGPVQPLWRGKSRSALRPRRVGKFAKTRSGRARVLQEKLPAPDRFRVSTVRK